MPNKERQESMPKKERQGCLCQIRRDRDTYAKQGEAGAGDGGVYAK